jgi:predicted transcriptional regulator
MKFLIVDVWQNEQVAILVKVQSLRRSHTPALGFSSTETVSEIRKPVRLRLIHTIDVEVLPPRVFDSLHEVETGSYLCC